MSDATKCPRLHHDTLTREIVQRGLGRAWSTCGRYVRTETVTTDRETVTCKQCRSRAAFKALEEER